jgi:hypothetical protein
MSRKREESSGTSSRGNGVERRLVACDLNYDLVPSAFARKLISVLLLFATGCTAIETKTGIYATVAEARAAGAIERGWIPEGLPASATDLREAHHGDRQQWGVFAFPPTDIDAMRRLVAAEITATPPACDPPGRLEWWPRILRSPLDVAQLHSTGLRLHRSRDGRLTYAINWNQGRAYYWRE